MVPSSFHSHPTGKERGDQEDREKREEKGNKGKVKGCRHSDRRVKPSPVVQTVKKGENKEIWGRNDNFERLAIKRKGDSGREMEGGGEFQ